MNYFNSTSIIATNYYLLQLELAKRNLLYLDVCEILQVNPLFRHDEKIISERIEKAKEHYFDKMIELILFKNKRREAKKALINEHGRRIGRKKYKDLMTLYKEEYKYVSEARKIVFAAEMFFIHMDANEYEKFFINFVNVATKKRFEPHPLTINNVWRPKKTFISLNRNSTQFQKMKTKKA